MSSESSRAVILCGWPCVVTGSSHLAHAHLWLSPWPATPHPPGSCARCAAPWKWIHSWVNGFSTIVPPSVWPGQRAIVSLFSCDYRFSTSFSWPTQHSDKGISSVRFCITRLLSTGLVSYETFCGSVVPLLIRTLWNVASDVAMANKNVHWMEYIFYLKNLHKILIRL